ncbi:hypothetical protein BDZ89DRAFT_1145032 [Hymenopellis radicata]|nr:hypothetical protein BDZ89DRAFT_1145032 [Hymenopellis radicata]
MSANTPRAAFNRRELLDHPSLTAQRVLRCHLSDLRTHWKRPVTGKARVEFTKKLLSINAFFLLQRFNDCGVYTVDDLRHMAGLVVKWEYEGLYRTGLGLLNCGTNWKALKSVCATLRMEEAEALETRFKNSVAKAGS